MTRPVDIPAGSSSQSISPSDGFPKVAAETGPIRAGTRFADRTAHDLWAERERRLHGYGRPLTPMQMRVLVGRARGLMNKEVGAELGVTEQSARGHISAALRKLGASSVLEACAKLGWLVIPDAAKDERAVKWAWEAERAVDRLTTAIRGAEGVLRRFRVEDVPEPTVRDREEET